MELSRTVQAIQIACFTKDVKAALAQAIAALDPKTREPEAQGIGANMSEQQAAGSKLMNPTKTIVLD